MLEIQVTAIVPDKASVDGSETPMALHPKLNHAASVRLARVAYLLTRAEQHLSASSLIPDRYSRDHLSRLNCDLRSIYDPLTAIVQALECERER